MLLKETYPDSQLEVNFASVCVFGTPLGTLTDSCVRTLWSMLQSDAQELLVYDKLLIYFLIHRYTTSKNAS